ncbi:M55 family metallopeptidase [Nonomuraea sp. NPDC050451]|uniref:M55 family metallopeptidase n=1 Tax=Nonomuraea sp. NPDC050451 TaxID=3364364 RepID=UPI0037BC3DB8
MVSWATTPARGQRLCARPHHRRRHPRRAHQRQLPRRAREQHPAGGSYGAPVVLASGDDAACMSSPPCCRQPYRAGQTRARPARGRHLASAGGMRQGASHAVSRRDEHRPVAASRPLDIEVTLHQPRTADLGALIPGIARTGRP